MENRRRKKRLPVILLVLAITLVMLPTSVFAQSNVFLGAPADMVNVPVGTSPRAAIAIDTSKVKSGSDIWIMRKSQNNRGWDRVASVKEYDWARSLAVPARMTPGTETYRWRVMLPDGNYEYSDAFTVTWGTFISSIAITNVPTPVVGQPCKADNLQITTCPVQGVQSWESVWYDELGNTMAPTDTFQAGKSYYLCVTVEPKDGYVFPCENNDSAGGIAPYLGTATVNGIEDPMPWKENSTDTAMHVYSQEMEAKSIRSEVRYMTHVQKYGWESAWKENGQISGTSGESLRLEAIRMNLKKPEFSGSIEYRTHIQTYGWEKDWKKDGDMSGTSGESKRLEAIQIRLTGEMAENYDVYYRVHAQQLGWLDWAKNGESAGTSGYSYRLEAIQVVLVPKGGPAPGSTATPYREPQVAYSTHVQNIGWQIPVMDGATAGTSGQSKRLEAIKMQLKNQEYSGNIEYRTHIQMLGWEKTWKKNGAMSGTSGKSYRLEAIQIKLTGEMAEHYDVYYRVHAQQFGWMGWAKNGESAGTAGYSYRLEGIQVKLVPKGSAAPGSAAKCFRQKLKNSNLQIPA